MKNKLKKLAVIAAVTVLTACGGGGGSAGETQLPYSITLRSDQAQLPLNVANIAPGLGAYSPYTSTLYVSASTGGSPIPEGTKVFGCVVDAGLDSGALYYLNGKDDAKDEKGNPSAFRSITLDANSGAASFHFHAGNKAGTARVTCSVTDPRDKQVRTASVNIVVGGATGSPASLLAVAQAPGYLGSSGNVNNLRSNVTVQASVYDDANQPIPNPAVNNLQVSILPSSASVGTRLLSGNSSGSVIQVRTVGGVAQFSLSSGPTKGTVLLQLVADRRDNDVTNGIQDAVTQLVAVSVIDAVSDPAKPLKITSGAAISATNGQPVAFAFSAEGGLPPYSWSAVGGLPTGLTLDTSGVLRGTVRAAAGDYSISIRAEDGAGAVVNSNVVLTVAGDLPFDPVTFSVGGCTGDVNTPCSIPAVVEKKTYLYVFSASGGNPATPINWTFTGLPSWLVGTPANGVVSSTDVGCNKGEYRFLVTAAKGGASISRQVSINVTADAVACP